MSSEGSLTPPPGYASAVPFDREAHRGLGALAGFRFAAGLHAIYITAQEFFRAATDYPIVFFSPEPGQWLPLALTGLTAGQNLFVDESGAWRPASYVPAYVRRYPFCTAAVSAEAGTEPQFAVYVDPSGLSMPTDPAEAFVDSSGNSTAAWVARERLIREMESARMVTEVFAARLHELSLLEAFEAHAQPVRGTPMLIKGLFRVSEEKLNDLPGDAVKGLMARGELSRIYAHLMSLDNFTTLLDLHASLAAT